jgi:amidophosphoribosyltransferase
MKEECGVVAVYRGEGQASSFVHRALLALQHRGEEAAGITAWDYAKGIQHLKGRGLVSECLPIYRVLKLVGSKAIGHVRYSTVSAASSENIQQFIASTPYGKLAIAHNGNLKNANELRTELERQGSLLSTTMDTELIAHLIAKSGKETFVDALKAATEKLVGAYSLTMICNDDLYGYRDHHGIRPLVLGERNDGWVIASETCALKAVNADYVREVEPGELIRIGHKGIRSVQLREPQKGGRCIFELVYFSRPDSTTFSKSVHAVRRKSGEILAREDKDLEANKPDIVVPVVDSGIPAAVGYSSASGIPLEIGLVRSHYIGRTFILPDQNSRTHSINLKLSAVEDVVAGKRVVLVDDSIVRGNTSRLIVKMVRDAGAKEVIMRIASPPIGWPCYLGIDTPDYNELIKNKTNSVKDIEKFIGADSLRYLSEEGLKEAAGNEDFCMGCMNGKYPV